MTFTGYHEERKRFFQGLEHFWPDLYGEEYAVFDVALARKEEYEAIRLAAGRIGSIFFKTAALLRKAPDASLLEMGFPEETLPFLRIQPFLSESVISRLDLVKTNDGYKCIEINSDTPTFIMECFSVNGRICAEFGADDPNEGLEEQLAKAVRSSVKEASLHLRAVNPYVVFTAHGDNIEDRETARYLQRISGVPSRFVSLADLAIDRGNGLFDEKGRQIDILYRQTYPIETMIEDEDAEGNKIGIWLLELVKSGKLAIINPPSAFLLQNKAVQAVIWALHNERNPFFTEEEHQWIDDIFLPAYLEPAPFLEAGEAYVKKPVFGREGDTVEIFGGNGERLLADPQTSYSQYVSLYQKYAELPIGRFKSEKGWQQGRILCGCFLINGKPSAIGFRAGGEITNNLSYYLPAGIKK